jgi:hypothetical protein
MTRDGADAVGVPPACGGRNDEEERRAVTTVAKPGPVIDGRLAMFTVSSRLRDRDFAF